MPPPPPLLPAASWLTPRAGPSCCSPGSPRASSQLAPLPGEPDLSRQRFGVPVILCHLFPQEGKHGWSRAGEEGGRRESGRGREAASVLLLPILTGPKGVLTGGGSLRPEGGRTEAQRRRVLLGLQRGQSWPRLRDKPVTEQNQGPRTPCHTPSPWIQHLSPLWAGKDNGPTPQSQESPQDCQHPPRLVSPPQTRTAPLRPGQPPSRPGRPSPVLVAGGSRRKLGCCASGTCVSLGAARPLPTR